MILRAPPRDSIELAWLLSYSPEEYWDPNVDTNRHRNLNLDPDKLHDLAYARDWMTALKNNDPCPGDTTPVSEFAAKRCTRDPLSNYFSKETTLVPIPSSNDEEKPWVPMKLANVLVTHGLGRVVIPCLERVNSIRSAHLSGTDRPIIEKRYNSMVVTDSLENPSEILLVDDVVTTGTMFTGAYRRIAEKYPNVPIKAFAAMRARFPECFRYYLDPCFGVITPKRPYANIASSSCRG